jgi:uroporphyrinogen decarboxylase
MTHRERVLCTLEHAEPDFVPLDLGSVGSLLVDPLYFEVKKLLGIEENIPPYRSGSTANYYDERVLEALDIDFRHLWLISPDKPISVKNPEGTVLDEWGILWSAEGSYPVHFPLKGATEEELAAYPWPLPEVPWNLDELRERARKLYTDTDYAIAAKSVFGGGGILERCYYLRSIEELFIDMSLRKPVARFIIDRVVEVELALWDMYLEAVGPYVQVVQRASDLGTQTSLFLSPDLYREFLKPAEEKVFRFIKGKVPHAKLWFHSCGAVAELIEDFIDIGVDILNPVQPLASGMDSFGLKERFGKRLCFHGGIDIQRAMPGTLEDVRLEAQTRIRAFAPGGGYILAPANHIQADTAAENVIALYRYARELGRYPLSSPTNSI